MGANSVQLGASSILLGANAVSVRCELGGYELGWERNLLLPKGLCVTREKGKN